MEGKISRDELNEVLKDKADMQALKDIIMRQNNLESFVHKQLNMKGPRETELVSKMLEGDEE